MLSNLFKVETLDTRFASQTGQPLSGARPSKWNTVEYYVYYAFFLTIPFLMVKSVYDVSQSSHPTFKNYEHLLSPGWIPGRKLDNSDDQYRGFRDNIPYMALLLVFHPLLRRAFEYFKGTGNVQNANGVAVSGEHASSSPQNSDTRLRNRTTFDLAFGVIFLIALHGVSIIKIFLILYLNFQITRVVAKRHAGWVTWAFNIGILFANELCKGYRIADLANAIVSLGSADVSWGKQLDSYGGLLPRWEILFNFSVLRMIAFNFDHLWSLDRRASSPLEVCVLVPPLRLARPNLYVADILQKKNLDPGNLPERERVANGARPTDFTFRNYLAYTLYSPLYLTGPIINFNDYICQLRYPLPSATTKRIVPYALRFAICLLTMEVVLHFLYAVAISKSNPDWNVYSPFQLSMLGYFNLHVIWLKLLLPWRFFRLWALMDGVDGPENMVRCMSNNYSALAFWRGWHRSFNRFIVRYIYIPLGGSGKTKVQGIVNFLLVFTFVALWHDINLRLLMWGWLITLFVLPEVIATLAFPAKKWQSRPDAYRVLCGIGAVGNILMMMAANLVGFAVGLDGLKGLVEGIVASLGGRIFLLAACITLFVGAQVMFEVRESEKRRGVNMKC